MRVQQSGHLLSFGYHSVIFDVHQQSFLILMFMTMYGTCACKFVNLEQDKDVNHNSNFKVL